MMPSCYCHKKCFHMRSCPPFGPKAMKRQKTTRRTTMYGQQTFLVHFFAVVSNDDNVKLPCRNFLVTRFMEEMLYVVPFTFFSVPLIFTLVAAGISHFLTAAIKLSCYSSNEIDLLFFFLSLTLARSSVIQ